MRKFLIFVIITLFIFTVSSCGNYRNIEFPFDLSEATNVTVEFYSMGQTEEWELGKEELSSWINWAKSLSGRKVSDKKVAELKMTEGGESYHFSDGKEISFSYVLNGYGIGSERYLVIGGNWYEVINPKDPF